MNQTLVLLFAIPVITFVLIGLYQFLDENTKKHFILERRGQGSAEADSGGAPRRRYSDTVTAGSLRHPEAEGSSKVAEAPVVQVQQG